MGAALTGSSRGAAPPGPRRSRRSRPSALRMAHTVWADTGLPSAVSVSAISLTERSPARSTMTRSRTVLNFPPPAGHLGPASAGGGWRHAKGSISSPVHRRVQEGRGGAVTLIGPANKGGGQAVGHIGHLA